MSLVGILLAAGKGKRFASDKSKVLAEFGSTPMVAIVARALSAVADRLIVVVGSNRDEIQAELSGIPADFVLQQQQLGTGHAVLVAESAVGDPRAIVLTSYADKPLVRASMFRHIAERHAASGALISVAVARMADPRRKGRVVRDAAGRFSRVVEYRDASEAERQIQEVHAGFLCAEAGNLFRRLKRIQPNNAAGEYYLTDVYTEYVNDGFEVNTVEINPSECWDVNTVDDLNAIMPERRAGANGTGQ